MCPTDLEVPLINETGALYTASEIAGQPDLWLKIYHKISEEKEAISSYLNDSLPEVTKIVLTGAGTSAYIGLTLQGVFNRSLKVHADAVATTDLVSHPGNYFFEHETILLISFARSGNSPESIAVVDLADKLCRKCFHIIITCDPDMLHKSAIRNAAKPREERGLATSFERSGPARGHPQGFPSRKRQPLGAHLEGTISSGALRLEEANLSLAHLKRSFFLGMCTSKAPPFLGPISNVLFSGGTHTSKGRPLWGRISRAST